MKKSIVVILGILALSLLSGPCASAQAPIKDVAYFPSPTHKPIRDAEAFIADWEKWSRIVAESSAPSEFNALLSKLFAKEIADLYEDPTLPFPMDYITLPLHVAVVTFDFDLYPLLVEKGSYAFMRYTDKDVLSDYPKSISFFTPVLESKLKPLYISPEIDDLIDSYIRDGGEWNRKSRAAQFCKLYLFSMFEPTILVGKDGFFVNYLMEDTECFVPWGKDPIVVTVRGVTNWAPKK